MKTLKITIAFCMLFWISGCKDYLDINQDPSNPQVAEGYVVLPPIFSQMVRGEAFDTRYAGSFVQYFGNTAAGNQWDRQGYISGSDAGGEKWRSHYWSIGTNVDIIIKDATAKNLWDYSGAAKAIRAWSWQSTTDWHGEMILKQAWEPNRYVFDYDTQEEVYAEVVRLCNDALADFNKPDYAKTLSRGDLVYKGDTDKWIRFVYSILARNAHHLSNKSNYNPDKVIEYVDKSLRNNADNFDVPHAGTNTGDANFYGPLRNNMGSFRQTNYVIGLMDGTVFNKVVDPRMPLMFTASPDGVFRGVAPAAGDPNNVAGNTKRIPNLWGALGVVPTTGKFIFDDKAAHSIVTYMELQFIKAEAAFKKGDKAMAFAAFRNGVGASLDYVKVSATDKATYLASAALPASADLLKLSDIMLQKYIALYGHGSLETWVDMRRYNYDPNVYTGFAIPSPLFPDNSNKTVQRVRPRYNSEYVWNRQALDKLGALLPDYHTLPLWFVKP
jgi:hypothetical protein